MRREPIRTTDPGSKISRTESEMRSPLLSYLIILDGINDDIKEIQEDTNDETTKRKLKQLSSKIDELDDEFRPPL